MKYGFVVPVYNHGSTLESVVAQLAAYGLPIIVVDDGNDERNKECIRAVAERHPSVDVVFRKKNGGKGRAMSDGVRRAHELGLTHVFQIDSDGQHDAGRIGFFLEKSAEHPDAVICGFPEYDGSAPLGRVNGRKVANAWVHIVTLSREVVDAMIGFRIYPVAPYCALLQRRAVLDPRMGYDIDILVHLVWLGVRVRSYSVRVFYPADGISNFKIVRDNLRIAGTYARLCLGMLVRLPFLLVRKARRKDDGRS
ncbi:MAG: glycosyltransferase family 2 protein [Treponemataceae bacterium]|nr:glycosyltransferase family 2 protein [Treponemataceae bacterium]